MRDRVGTRRRAAARGGVGRRAAVNAHRHGPATTPAGVMDTMRARRSVRVFTEKAVAREKIHAVLGAANRAPSAGNLQAYEVYVVHNRPTRERLALAAGGQSAVAHAPVLLVFCASPARSAVKYGERGKLLFSVQDATIACAYAQLAAAALGLGAVWVGAFDEGAAREALGLTRELRPVAMLPIGYPGEEPLDRGRRPLASLAHYVPAAPHLEGDEQTGTP